MPLSIETRSRERAAPGLEPAFYGSTRWRDLARLWVTPLCLIWLAAPLGAVAQTLTEVEAARLALSGPEWEAAAAARRSAAQARAAAAGLRPDPELELSREGGEGFGGAGTEDSARLAYPLDFGGARRAERRAGQAQLGVQAAEAEQRSAERALDARRLFHEVASLTRRETVLGRRSALLGTALTITRRRHAEGDISELELRRLELEEAAARAEQERTAAERAGARARLGALIGPEAPAPTAAGAILPPLPPVDTYLALVEQSPAVRRAAAEAVVAEAEAEAARRQTRFANTAVFGGVRSVDDTLGRTTGLILGGRVGLPVLGAGRGRLQAELAEANAARAEERLLIEQRRRAAVGAWASASRLGQAAVQASDAASLQDRVFPPAMAAFEAGEIELTELLNIYRTANEAELAAVDLALEAAQARIELDALVGKMEP